MTHGIMVSKIEKEVDEMCNLSQYHVDKGHIEGRIEECVLSIKNIMKSLKLSRKKAIEVLDVSEDLLPEVNRILDEEEKEKSK